MPMTLLLSVVLFAADPNATSLDRLVERAMQSSPAFAADWNKAAASSWSDSKVVQVALGYARLFPKKDDLKLAVAREMVRRKRADDAWRLFEKTSADDVSDVAAFHFLRGGILQTLGRNDEAVRAFLALEGIAGVPERYLAASKAIRAELAGLKRDTLPGIARDMREIRRRLDVGLPDARTQRLNEDVVKRLDKLIADIKEKANKAKRSGASKPSKPAEESKPDNGKSKGEIAEGRQFRDFSKWGDLPAKEREKALQDLSRDFPAHYRDAVDEYFKKLAKDGGEPRK